MKCLLVKKQVGRNQETAGTFFFFSTIHQNRSVCLSVHHRIATAAHAPAWNVLSESQLISVSHLCRKTTNGKFSPLEEKSCFCLAPFLFWSIRNPPFFFVPLCPGVRSSPDAEMYSCSFTGCFWNSGEDTWQSSAEHSEWCQNKQVNKQLACVDNETSGSQHHSDHPAPPCWTELTVMSAGGHSQSMFTAKMLIS